MRKKIQNKKKREQMYFLGGLRCVRGRWDDVDDEIDDDDDDDDDDDLTEIFHSQNSFAANNPFTFDGNESITCTSDSVRPLVIFLAVSRVVRGRLLINTAFSLQKSVIFVWILTLRLFGRLVCHFGRC